MHTTETRGRITVDRWESPAEFAKMADASLQGGRQDWRDGWSGSSRAQALNDCVNGDLSLVPEAESLLAKILLAVDTPLTQWEPSVAGAFPCVPDYLLGRPDSMRRRETRDSALGPIKIYFDLTSSGGIGADDLKQRGIAFLALAMALSNVRPTEIWACVALGGGKSAICAIRIPTAPLDVATAAAAFTNGAVARCFGYEWLREKRGAGGQWLETIMPVGESGQKEYAAAMRRGLGADPGDIVIPPVYLTDEKAIADPVGFVQGALDKYARAAEDDNAR